MRHRTRRWTRSVAMSSDVMACRAIGQSSTGGVFRTTFGVQEAVALISAEVQAHALDRSAVEAIGVQSLVAEFGVRRTVVYTKPTAAVAIMRRRGAGKLARLNHVGSKLQCRVVAPSLNRATGRNPADSVKKHVSGQDKDAYKAIPGFSTQADQRG